MNIDNYLKSVAVIGAGGKMGSGVALLLAQEMARLKCTLAAKGETTIPQLVLIDPNPEALDGLRTYIEKQTIRKANKTIRELRPLYAKHPDCATGTDAKIVAAFVADTLSVINTTTDLAAASAARLVFEVIPEIEELKISTFKKLRGLCSEDTFFLSNTSSIPIRYLNAAAGLGGRLIGFHFYNPPAIQKLVELIPAVTTQEELVAVAHALGERLGKIIIPARDIAGFIGNGYFIRDGLYAIQEAEWLKKEWSWAGAIHALNRVSQEGLLRPMGIFQLLDYVGLDVFVSIMKVLTEHLVGNDFQSATLDALLAAGIRGGQNSDGTHKDGFFKYENNLPIAVYAVTEDRYIPLDDDATFAKVNEALGSLTAPGISWKELLGDESRAEKLAAHFAAMKKLDTRGTHLTLNYLLNFRQIGETLISNGVAAQPADIDAVLENGFYHLYGPFHDCISNG